MATRSNLIIEDNYNRIQLYRHWDGYPDGESGVLADLERAIPYAWPLPRFEASDFAAAIVRAWKVGGGNIYIDGSPKAWEMIHTDVEWVYTIFPDTRSDQPGVAVYNWHKYWLDKVNPHKIKPKPIVRVSLAKAKQTGLTWKR